MFPMRGQMLKCIVFELKGKKNYECCYMFQHKLFPQTGRRKYSILLSINPYISYVFYVKLQFIFGKNAE